MVYIGNVKDEERVELVKETRSGKVPPASETGG
jgi:hypothetical protein